VGNHANLIGVAVPRGLEFFEPLRHLAGEIAGFARVFFHVEKGPFIRDPV